MERTLRFRHTVTLTIRSTCLTGPLALGNVSDTIQRLLLRLSNSSNTDQPPEP